MFRSYFIYSSLIYFFCIKLLDCASVRKFDSDACDKLCWNYYAKGSNVSLSCSEGCHLFTAVGFVKGVGNYNKIAELCKTACDDAFSNETSNLACHHGCDLFPSPGLEGDMFRPLMHVHRAFEHMRQLVMNSWMVYVQADTGRLLVVQKGTHEYEIPVPEGTASAEVEEVSSSSDWVDCLAVTLNLPRWILLFNLYVLFLFLIWALYTTASAGISFMSYIYDSPIKSKGIFLVFSDEDMKMNQEKSVNDTETAPIPEKEPLL